MQNYGFFARHASIWAKNYGKIHLVVYANKLIFAVKLEVKARVKFGFPPAVIFAPLGRHFCLLAIHFGKFARLVEFQRTTIVELDIVVCVQQASVQRNISDLGSIKMCCNDGLCRFRYLVECDHLFFCASRQAAECYKHYRKILFHNDKLLKG